MRLVLAGQASAVVTNPIAKSVLQSAGFPHPGHTEFLAELTGAAGREIMMLASPMLRVVPVTIHLSLRAALDALSTEAIVAAARTTACGADQVISASLPPGWPFAGLNPHAGEQGRDGHGGDHPDPAGHRPAAAPRASRRRGRLPPDTMFTQAARATYDAAICMYHDQALIPLKTLDMWGGVNVTLGLPIVRTSPDHGTAFGIAGAGHCRSIQPGCGFAPGVRDSGQTIDIDIAMPRLGVNIDHVATLRNARGGSFPDPLEAAPDCAWRPGRTASRCICGRTGGISTTMTCRAYAPR